MMTSAALLQAFHDANNSIETYITDNIDTAIFQRAGTGYNDTYDRHVTSYGNLTPHYKREADKARGGENAPEGTGIYPKYSLPDAGTFDLHACATPTGTCYGYYKSTYEDWRSCMHKHGLEGDTDYEYWTCQSEGGNCPRTSEHWVAC